MTIPRPSGRQVAFIVVGAAIAVTAFLADPGRLFDDDVVAAQPVVRDTGRIEVSTLATDFDAEGTLAYETGVTAYVLAPPGEESVSTVGSGRSA